MKKFLDNHGLLSFYLVLLALGLLFGASEAFFVGVVLGGIFFTIYGKLHDILLVLRSQPQFSGCIINAHSVNYTPDKAISNIFQTTDANKPEAAQPEQHQ